jgi:hypothetical protein
MKKAMFLREYRILLEKLIENKVRLAECKMIPEEEAMRLQKKIDALIDKLIMYYHQSLDRSLNIISNENGKKRYS